MAAVGVILLSNDGIVIAADTPANGSGPANDTIRQIRNDLGCVLYAPVNLSDQFLQAYVAANQPLPPTAPDVVQGLVAHMNANHPAAPGVGLAVVGLDPTAHTGFIVHEVGWNGQTVYANRFPGTLSIGAHSIVRYLNARMRNFNRSVDLAKKDAAFAIGETRQTLPHLVRRHITIATIRSADGFQWIPDEEVALLANDAAERSRTLAKMCIGLF